MKSFKALLATLAVAAASTVAHADQNVNLMETFESGATFNGVLTFSDSFDQLKGVTGVLDGGSYGTQSINWAWWLGTGQNSVARDYDGIANTYEDWLMNGVAPNYSIYIGVSWFAPVNNNTFTLSLSPFTSVYHAGVNGTDAAVSYSSSFVSSVPEPESYALMLAGLGLMGAVARRRKQA